MNIIDDFFDDYKICIKCTPEMIDELKNFKYFDVSEFESEEVEKLILKEKLKIRKHKLNSL